MTDQMRITYESNITLKKKNSIINERNVYATKLKYDIVSRVTDIVSFPLLDV